MIHIAIHALPHEIDQLEHLLVQLKRNAVHLPKDHGIKVEVALNMGLVDWKASKLSKDFFLDKFHHLHVLTSSWAFTIFTISGYIKGCNDIRRYVIRTTDRPYVMYLDVDNVFSPYLLLNVWQFCQQFDGRAYHVLTPQTTRMWDSTWDCITNKHHMNEDASHANYDVRDPYEAVMYTNVKDRKVSLIPEFKFAGWGTVISTKLARLIDIPDSLGSYGLDDTYLAYGCYILRENGYQVHQFVIENEVIIENNLFRFNPYKDYLVNIDRREEFLAQAHLNFNPELDKLKLRIT